MIAALTLPAISIGLGLSANAYFLFGNLAESQMGPVTLISKPEERKKLGLSAGRSAQVFDTFFHRASKRFAAASAVSALAYLSTAYLQRKEPSSTLSTRLYLASGLLSLFPAPWTLLVMMPTNRRLMAQAKASAEGSAVVNEKPSVDDFDRDIANWVTMNSARIVALGVSYALSLYNILVL